MRHFVWPLVRRCITGLVLLLAIPAMSAVALLVILGIDRTDVSDDPDLVLTPDGFELEQQLATTIGFRSGLIRPATTEEARLIYSEYESPEVSPSPSDATIESLDEVEATGVDQPAKDPSPAPAAWVATFGRLSMCSKDSRAQAIVAVESYLRPAWVRRLEEEIVQSIYVMTGHLVDWSLGRAQIRPSTARKILTDASDRISAAGLVNRIEMTNAVVLEQTGDTCASVILTELAIILYGDKGDTPAIHALRHIGGKPVPTIPGVVEYTGVVQAIASDIMPAAQHNRDLLMNPGEQPELPAENNKVSLSYYPTSWSDKRPEVCLRAFGDSSIEAISFAPKTNPPQRNISFGPPLTFDHWALVISLPDPATVLSPNEALSLLKMTNAAHAHANDANGDIKLIADTAIQNAASLARNNQCDAVVFSIWRN